MLVIRDPQMALLGAASLEAFVRRMLRYVENDFPAEYRRLGEAGVRDLLQRLADEGRALGIETEGAVAVLLQLTLMFGPGFERSPDAAWAQAFLRNTAVPDSLRMKMVRDRLTERTQGRSIVRHVAQG